MNYYRIKQTDYDGRFTYSSTVAVRINYSEISVNSIYPVPASDQIHFIIHTPSPVGISVQVFDLAGREVLSGPIDVIPGNAVYGIEVSMLNAGSYLLRLSDDANTIAQQKIFISGR